MAAATDFLERSISRHVLSGAPLIGFTPYLGLMTNDTAGDATIFTEPSVTHGYARVNLNDCQAYNGLGAATTRAFSQSDLISHTGSLSNSEIIIFPVATENWAMVYGWFIANSATGSEVLIYGTMSARAVMKNERLYFLQNQIVFNIN